MCSIPFQVITSLICILFFLISHALTKITTTTSRIRWPLCFELITFIYFNRAHLVRVLILMHIMMKNRVRFYSEDTSNKKKTRQKFRKQQKNNHIKYKIMHFVFILLSLEFVYSIYFNPLWCNFFNIWCSFFFSNRHFMLLHCKHRWWPWWCIV